MSLREDNGLCILSLFKGRVSQEIQLINQGLGRAQVGTCQLGPKGQSIEELAPEFVKVLSRKRDDPEVNAVFLNLTFDAAEMNEERIDCVLGVLREISANSESFPFITDVIVNRNSILKERIRQSTDISAVLRHSAIKFWDDDATLQIEDSKYRDTSANSGVQSMVWLHRQILAARAQAYLTENEQHRFTCIRNRAYFAVMHRLNNGEYDSQIEIEESAYKNHLAFDVDAELSTDSPLLTVYFNGAIDPARAAGRPVFQRKSWWPELPGDSSSIPDPTQSAYSNLALGWGQGTKTNWGVISQAAMVSGLSTAWREFNELTSDEGRVNLYGSSGGGFQALAVGTFTSVSNVIVNNPQVDWLKYEGRSHVRQLMQEVYGPHSNNPSFRDTWSYRISVIDLWRAVGFAPEFTYVVNSASRFDLKNQVNELLKFWSTYEGASMVNNSQLRFYSAPEDGHNPLLTRELIELLN